MIRNSGGQLDERKLCSLIGASRNAVLSWISALESTLLVRRLQSFEAPIQRMARGLKPKLYASESSLVQAFALPSERLQIRAALFEAAVFKALRQLHRAEQIMFIPALRGAGKRRGAEVDFLVDRGETRVAIEVTTGSEGPDKAASLQGRARGLGLTHLMVVTDGAREHEHAGSHLVPLHHFLFEPARYLP